MPDGSTLLSGTFFRIVFEADLPNLLAGAKSPEGRFHHDNQPALYLSPTADAAGHAIATYLHLNDPPRVIAALSLHNARVVDLRNPAILQALDLDGQEASTPWQPERGADLAATTWRASDAPRATGADGMIYTARSAPKRWHLVLFRWNQGSQATVHPTGPATTFDPR